MAEAGRGANPGDSLGWRWDVALSFAAAQRDYVEQVARALQAQGVRCFYDADEEIDLWGKYLRGTSYLWGAGGGGRGVRVGGVRGPGLDPAGAAGRARSGGAGAGGVRCQYGQAARQATSGTAGRHWGPSPLSGLALAVIHTLACTAYAVKPPCRHEHAPVPTSVCPLAEAVGDRTFVVPTPRAEISC